MTQSLNYSRITVADLEDWLELAHALWPDAGRESLREELAGFLSSAKEASFIVRTAQGEAVAFMNLSLRHDYVPGTTERPVAYLEGIYVTEAYRARGVAAELLGRAGVWARAQGCAELASDALLENVQSHAFHAATGFREVQRVVCYVKTLD